MRRPLVLVCLSLAAGCAGGEPASASAAAPALTAGGESAAHARLREAERALAGCRARHASDPGWPAREAYDALVPRLSAHLASLSPPREVSPDEVQPYAEETWALLDRIDFPSGSEPARDRAETAVERVLRERDAGSAPGAAIELLDAVTQLAAAADPSGAVDPCAAEALVAAEARVGDQACED